MQRVVLNIKWSFSLIEEAEQEFYPHRMVLPQRPSFTHAQQAGTLIDCKKAHVTDAGDELGTGLEDVVASSEGTLMAGSS